MRIRNSIRNLQHPSKFTVTTYNEELGTQTSVNEAEDPEAYWDKMR